MQILVENNVNIYILINNGLATHRQAEIWNIGF